MRIAIVWGDDIYPDHHDLDANDLGEELGEFCEALASYGHSVTACPRQGRRPRAGQTPRPFLTVPTGVGPPAPASPAKVLPFIGEWAAGLARLWSAEPPDIVHSIGWLGGLAAQLAARRDHLTTVQSFFGLAATTPTPIGRQSASSERARLEPLLIRNATWVTGGSGEEMARLAKLRRNRARTSVLSAGIDVARFTDVNPKRDGDGLHRIVQVAPNLASYNGFDRTIRVLPLLPGSELVIAETAAGDSALRKERAKLKRLAVELGVGKRVRFAGRVVPEDLPSLLWSADVVACTPHLAPHATTALQAMASGRVVVATAVGALTDTVIGGVTGMLVSPSKLYDLAGALKILQRHRFQRQSMGSAGRSRALSRFAWNRIAQDALSIYEQASFAKTNAIA